MATEGPTPINPLDFIQRCVRERRVFWTYHINMRMKDRAINRAMILAPVESFEIIEAYPDDKYLPSYLVHTQHSGTAIHVLFATDMEHGNVRVVTAYRPSPEEWNPDMKTRKKP